MTWPDVAALAVILFGIFGGVALVLYIDKGE